MFLFFMNFVLILIESAGWCRRVQDAVETRMLF